MCLRTRLIVLPGRKNDCKNQSCKNEDAADEQIDAQPLAQQWDGIGHRQKRRDKAHRVGDKGAAAMDAPLEGGIAAH